MILECAIEARENAVIVDGVTGEPSEGFTGYLDMQTAERVATGVFATAGRYLSNPEKER